MPKLSNRENVVEYMERATKEMTPDHIKLMHESGPILEQRLNYPTVKLQRTIVEEAKKRDYLVVVHAASLQDTLDVLEAGVGRLTYTFCDKPPTQEVIDAHKRIKAWTNPTVADIGCLTIESKDIQHKFGHDSRAEGLLDEAQVGYLCACMAFAAEHGKVEYTYESVQALKAARIEILQ